MTLGPVGAPRVKGYLIQCLVLISINVPTVSFGLAMGWVSLASGGSGGTSDDSGGTGDDSGGTSEGTLVGAAAATFAAGLVGVPLGARALLHGRRPALAATSAGFVVCWALTLAGGWWVVSGRLCAGVAGAAAWCVAPLAGREMVSAGARGAAAAAPVLAHNLGMLLMYCAADARIQHSTVVWCCLALSVLHCGVTLLVPESPPYLAARGRHKEAVSALACLRGVRRDHPALAEELRAVPPPDEAAAAPLSLALATDMLSDRRRRRAFMIALIAVVGQEACGVLSVLQFAERVFLLASEGEPGDAGAGAGAGAARLALVLGVVQLVAAAAALYLLERVGRRPLVVWGACLALGAGWARAGRGARWAGGALAAAVAADSLGLQPAPYAILADMFHYQFRGCAVLLVMAAASVGNAAETLVFPAVTRAAGLWAALALAASLTLAYALFALIYIPETRNRSPDDIYDAICPDAPDHDAQNTPPLSLKNNASNEVCIIINTGEFEPTSISVCDVEPKNERDTSKSCNEGEINHCKEKNSVDNCDISCEQTSESVEISSDDRKQDRVRNDSVTSRVARTSVVSIETREKQCCEETQCTSL